MQCGRRSACWIETQRALAGVVIYHYPILRPGVVAVPGWLCYIHLGGPQWTASINLAYLEFPRPVVMRIHLEAQVSKAIALLAVAYATWAVLEEHVSFLRSANGKNRPFRPVTIAFSNDGLQLGWNSSTCTTSGNAQTKVHVSW